MKFFHYIDKNDNDEELDDITEENESLDTESEDESEEDEEDSEDGMKEDETMTSGTNVDQDNYDEKHFDVNQLLEDEDTNVKSSKKPAKPKLVHILGTRRSGRLQAGGSKTSQNNANNQTSSNVTSTKANQSSRSGKKTKKVEKEGSKPPIKRRKKQQPKPKTDQERKAKSRALKQSTKFLICQMKNPALKIGSLTESWCDGIQFRPEKLVSYSVTQ